MNYQYPTADHEMIILIFGIAAFVPLLFDVIASFRENWKLRQALKKENRR